MCSVRVLSPQGASPCASGLCAQCRLRTLGTTRGSVPAKLANLTDLRSAVPWPSQAWRAGPPPSSRSMPLSGARLQKGPCGVPPRCVEARALMVLTKLRNEKMAGSSCQLSSGWRLEATWASCPSWISGLWTRNWGPVTAQTALSKSIQTRGRPSLFSHQAETKQNKVSGT